MHLRSIGSCKHILLCSCHSLHGLVHHILHWLQGKLGIFGLGEVILQWLFVEVDFGHQWLYDQFQLKWRLRFHE